VLNIVVQVLALFLLPKLNQKHIAAEKHNQLRQTINVLLLVIYATGIQNLEADLEAYCCQGHYEEIGYHVDFEGKLKGKTISHVIPDHSNVCLKG